MRRIIYVGFKSEDLETMIKFLEEHEYNHPDVERMKAIITDSERQG